MRTYQRNAFTILDTYFTADTKAMPASVQGVRVSFEIDMDFPSRKRFET
jgi:hypothetical protein